MLVTLRWILTWELFINALITLALLWTFLNFDDTWVRFVEDALLWIMDGACERSVDVSLIQHERGVKIIILDKDSTGVDVNLGDCISLLWRLFSCIWDINLPTDLAQWFCFLVSRVLIGWRVLALGLLHRFYIAGSTEINFWCDHLGINLMVWSINLQRCKIIPLSSLGPLFLFLCLLGLFLLNPLCFYLHQFYMSTWTFIILKCFL